MKQVINFIIIGILSLANLSAQYVLPEDMIGKHKDGQLFVRWEPVSLSEWQESLDSGYDVEIEEFKDGSYVNVHKAKVKPGSVKQMSDLTQKMEGPIKNFYGSSRDVMYPEYAQKVYVEDIVSRFLDKTESTLDSFRVNMLSYFSIFDSDLAQLNGLGYSWKYNNGTKYRITLSVGSRSLRSIIIDTNEKSIDPLLKLDATFGDRKVKLAWDTKDHVDESFGFYVSKSEDGLVYDRLEELPYVLSRPEPGEAYIGRLGAEDSLAQNYKTYYYKIRALDYFGHLSEKVSSISGQGFEEMQFSPRIINAEQLENNDALLEWDVNDSDYPLIDHYSILRADSVSGYYEIALDSIEKSKTGIAFQMEHETNFFRLEAVSAYGQRVSSTPVFIMGMDTVPPATPIVIGASIDSFGQVQISWNANTESDLWGYKIFKSNFASDEYTLITAEPTLDTVLIDSTHLDLGIEEVFYMIQACDLRNNRSDFTEPIIIEKPDVVPPFKPIINRLTQQNDSLIIDWVPSASDDVVYHKFFRRAIDTETKWTLIAVLDSNTVLKEIVEVGLDYDVEYAYTIIAIDDAKLESEPAALQSTLLRKPVVIFEPEILTEAFYDEELEEVSIKWNCTDSENVDSYLVYKGTNPKRMSRYQYVDGKELMLTEKVKAGNNLYYRICPLYKGVNKTFYGDIVEVIVDGE